MSFRMIGLSIASRVAAEGPSAAAAFDQLRRPRIAARAVLTFTYSGHVMMHFPAEVPAGRGERAEAHTFLLSM